MLEVLTLGKAVCSCRKYRLLFRYEDDAAASPCCAECWEAEHGQPPVPRVPVSEIMQRLLRVLEELGERGPSSFLADFCRQKYTVEGVARPELFGQSARSHGPETLAWVRERYAGADEHVLLHLLSQSGPILLGKVGEHAASECVLDLGRGDLSITVGKLRAVFRPDGDRWTVGQVSWLA